MLLLRGLWWRRGFAVAVLACGLAAITVVALGPLYARAAAESTLTDELRAGGAATSLDVTAATVGGDSSAPARVQGQLGPTTAIAGFGPAVTGLSMAITGRSPGAAYSTGSTMVSRSGQCAHLTLVAGTCPSGPGDAIVDEQSRDEGPRWQLGQTLTVRQGISTPDGVVDGPVVGSVRVVGVYRPVDTEEAYWSGLPYFNTRLGPAADAAKQGVDAVFVTPAQFAALPPQVDSDPIGVEVDVDIPLDAGRVHLDDLPALRSSVAAAQRRFPPLSSPPTPELLTGLSGVLADAARDRRQVDTATTVVVAELVALCLLVLFQVVTAAVDGRRDEIALATLRGLPPTRLVWFALAEPVTLLLLATVGGIPLAVVLTHVLARAFLVVGTPVVVPAAAVIAGLAALSATAAASGLAAARTLRRPVLEQWRGTVRSRAPWRGVAFDLLLAAAAVIAVVMLRRADSTALDGAAAGTCPARVRDRSGRRAPAASDHQARRRSDPGQPAHRSVPRRPPGRPPPGRDAAGRAARRRRRPRGIRRVRRGRGRRQPAGPGPDRGRRAAGVVGAVRDRPRSRGGRRRRRPGRTLGDGGGQLVARRRPGHRDDHRRTARCAAGPAGVNRVRGARPIAAGADRPADHRTNRPAGGLSRPHPEHQPADHGSGRRPAYGRTRCPPDPRAPRLPVGR